MATTVECTECGHRFTIGLTLQDVSIEGAAMNIAVTCPRCGVTFDATGGGDGTFSTLDGELRRVGDAARSLRNALVHAPTEELRELRRTLIERRDDLGIDLGEELISSGHFPTFEAWAQRNPALLNTLLAGAIPILIYILTVLGGQDVTVNVDVAPAVVEEPAGLTDEDLDRVVEELLREAGATTTTVRPPEQDVAGDQSEYPRRGDGPSDADVPPVGEHGDDGGGGEQAQDGQRDGGG